MNACLNCVVCTAVCPAAEFDDYFLREMMNEVQSEDDEAIAAQRHGLTIILCVGESKSQRQAGETESVGTGL
jgi:heterodisulfide reductase subunit C